MIKLDYDKDRIDQPIGCGVYEVLRYDSHVIQREVLKRVHFRNRDGTCWNPEKKLGIKLSDLIPDDAGLLASDDFVFDITHKQLNDLVDQGQAWERDWKQMWIKEREEAANRVAISKDSDDVVRPASPEYEVTIKSPDDSDLDDDASSASWSGDEISPWMSDSDSTKNEDTEVEDGESEDASAPSTSAAERGTKRQCRDTAHHADHNEESIFSSKDRGPI